MSRQRTGPAREEPRDRRVGRFGGDVGAPKCRKEYVAVRTAPARSFRPSRSDERVGRME